MLKLTFLNNLPALHKLIDAVQSAAERGHITGLDKRQIKVRTLLYFANCAIPHQRHQY